MTIEAKRIEPLDEEILEEWRRVTDEEHILGVNVTRMEGDWPWHVAVSVAEFIREEPLQSKLHARITEALSQAPGVQGAEQEDREVWIVRGDVSGEALIRACGRALDSLAAELRAAYAAL
jgi:hypothetical protein